MSRFADPSARAKADIGECQCPGTPHARDEATFRVQLGASALARIGRAEIDAAVLADPLAAHRRLILESVESWNLLWLQPQWEGDEERPIVPVPINASTIGELDEDTLKGLAKTIDDRMSGGPPPNDSGAPSPESSPGSASPTRTRTPKRGT